MLKKISILFFSQIVIIIAIFIFVGMTSNVDACSGSMTCSNSSSTCYGDFGTCQRGSTGCNCTPGTTVSGQIDCAVEYGVCRISGGGRPPSGCGADNHPACTPSSGGGDTGGGDDGGGGDDDPPWEPPWEPPPPTPYPACVETTHETYGECGPFNEDDNVACTVRRYTNDPNQWWCAEGNQWGIVPGSCQTCERGCSGGECNACTQKEELEVYDECGPFSEPDNHSCKVRKFRYTEPGCPVGDQFELVEGSCKRCLTCSAGVCENPQPLPTNTPTLTPTLTPTRPPAVCVAPNCGANATAVFRGGPNICGTGGSGTANNSQCASVGGNWCASSGCCYICVANAPTATRTPSPTTLACRANNQTCTVNSQCCSGNCADGVGALDPSTCKPAAAPTSAPTCSSSQNKPNGCACTSDTQCDGSCNNGTCGNNPRTTIVFQTRNVTARIFEDANANGTKEANEVLYTGSAAISIRENNVLVASETFTGGSFVRNVPRKIPTDVSAVRISLSTIPGRTLTTVNDINKTITSGTNYYDFGLVVVIPTVTPTNAPSTAYNLSGNIYEDTGSNTCASGATALSGVAIRMYRQSTQLRNTTGSSYSFTGTTNPSIAHTLSATRGGYSVIGIRTPGGGSGPFTAYTLSDYSITDFTTSIDFCLRNNTIVNSPWFMTEIGSVRQPIINNNVPTGQLPTSQGNNASVFYSTDGMTFLGHNQASGLKWQINDEYEEIPSVNREGNASFSFYKNRAETTGTQFYALPGCPTVGTPGNCTYTGNINALPANRVYYVEGNLTLSNNSQIDGAKRYIFLASGTITVNGRVTVNNANTLVILAAKDDVVIGSGVGGAATDSTFHVQSIITAEDDVILQNSNTCPTAGLKLNIEGTIVANADNPFGVERDGGILDNRRDLCAQNTTYPSLYVKPRLSFITQLSDFYKISNKFWNEIAP